MLKLWQRWENSRTPPPLDVRRKFDKFQFPTNSLGQGSSTYSASDKFSISTPLLYAKRPVSSLHLTFPLSLFSSLSLSLSLSLSSLLTRTQDILVRFAHVPDTRVHTVVNAETLFCISNVAYSTFDVDRQDADLPRKSGPPTPARRKQVRLERRVSDPIIVSILNLSW